MACTNYNISGASSPITINITAVNFTANKTSDKCIFQSAAASEKITYTLTVTNNGTASQTYQLTDILTSGAFPGGVTLTLTTVSGPAIQLVLIDLSNLGLLVPVVTLAAGATWQGTATYQPLAGDIGQVIKNTFTVNAGSLVSILGIGLLFVALAGQSITSVNTVDYAHLTLTETYTPTTVAIGTTIIYSYILTNNSTIPVNNIVITDNSNPGPAKFLPGLTSNVYTLTPSYTLAPSASTAAGDIPNATYLITTNTPITATATATATTVCTSGACVLTGSLAGAPYVPQAIVTESKAISAPQTSSISSAAAVATNETKSANSAAVQGGVGIKPFGSLSLALASQPKFNLLSTNDCVKSTVKTESDKKIIQPNQAVQPVRPAPNCTNPKKHAPHQRCVHCK